MHTSPSIPDALKKWVRAVWILMVIGTHSGAQEAAEETASEPETPELYYEVMRPATPPWDLSVSATYDFSDAYQKHYGLKISGLRKLPFEEALSAGLRTTFWWQSEKAIAGALRKQLEEQNLGASWVKPRLALQPTIVWTPLSGLVNLLGSTVLTTDLHLEVYGGVVLFSGRAWGASVGIDALLDIGPSPDWGIRVGVANSWEDQPQFGWTHRIGITAGPFMRLP